MRRKRCFFPGARPYRALLKNPITMTGHSLQLTRAVDVAGVESGLGTALMENPWIERWPVVVGPVTVAAIDDRWVLQDHQGRHLPMARSLRHGWSLAALTGGDPVNYLRRVGWFRIRADHRAIQYDALLARTNRSDDRARQGRVTGMAQSTVDPWDRIISLATLGNRTPLVCDRGFAAGHGREIA